MSPFDDHVALHDRLESLNSWSEALAGRTAFIVSVYVAAIIPWAFLTAFDSIDQRWRPIHKLYTRTFFQSIFIVASVSLLALYVVVQFIAKDIKEAMAGVAVLLAAFFPASRVIRQLWIIFATRSFAEIIRTVPNLTGDCPPDTQFGQLSDHIFSDCTPELFNSSHFFDNDKPGDGVLHLGLTNWPLDMLNSWLATWRLSSTSSTKSLSTDFADGKLDTLIRAPRYRCAFVVSKYRLRIVDCLSFPEPAEDILTRMAWMYGNSFVHPHDHPFSPSRKIIHLGLLVQVGYSMWVETRQNFAILKRDSATDNTAEEQRALEMEVWEYQNLFGKFSWFVPFLGDNTLSSLEPSLWGANLHVPISSRTSAIWTCDYTLGIVPTKAAGLEFSPQDYDEAHLKLPVTSGTTAEHIFHGYRWEHTAEIISSTLELHSLKTSLLGDDTIFDTGDQLADTVWTYVYVAVMLGTYGKDIRKYISMTPKYTSVIDEAPEDSSFSIPEDSSSSILEIRSQHQPISEATIFAHVRGIYAFSSGNWGPIVAALRFMLNFFRVSPSDNSADLKDVRELLLRLAGKSESRTGLQSTESRTADDWWTSISAKCLVVADLISYAAKPIPKTRSEFYAPGLHDPSSEEGDYFLRNVSPARMSAREGSSKRPRRELHRDAAPEDPRSGDQRSKLQKKIDEAEKASREILENADQYIRRPLHELKLCTCMGTDVESRMPCAWQVEQTAADPVAQSSDAPSARNDASEVSAEERKWEEWTTLAR